MFNADNRLSIFVDMIMATNENQRKHVLDKLGELQKNDFIQILKAMEGYKVTIRLLDPPLHEFLPNPEELMDKIYKNKNDIDISETKKVLNRAKELQKLTQ